MRVFFLSDLHLDDGESPATKRFENFLRREPGPGDSVVLGGDIFDLFVGDKAVFRERFRGALRALADLGRRGINIHYLEGNHDFHLRGVFAGQPGIELHTDAFPLTAGARRLWVAHGDLIDPDDRGYRFLRWFTRLAGVRALVRVLPGGWIDGIGRLFSRESRRYHNPERAQGEASERLRRLYVQYAGEKAKEGYHHVLVGHSHLRDQVDLPGGEYVNIGFSSESLIYAVLPDGAARFELREFR